MNYVFYIALGYLSGSVLYSYFLPLWLKGLDVTRDTPDGNPGTFNCISKAGWPLGLLALACDVLKGAAPVLLAANALGTSEWAFALVAAAPAAGHAWPVFRRFRGGKAIAVSFGAALGLWPVWQPFGVLAACYLFFSLVVRLEPHRFRSIVTYLCFGAWNLIRFGTAPAALGCALTALTVISRHWRPEPAEEPPRVRFALRRQE